MLPGVIARLHAGQVVPGRFVVGKAVDLANRVRVVLHPHRQRQGQVLLDLPLVLGIDAEAPQGDRHVAGLVVRLTVAARQTFRKSLQRSAGDAAARAEEHARIVVEEVVVAHVVAAEIAAELEAVLSMVPGVVVDELVLRDITSLGERAHRVERGERHISGKAQAGGKCVERQGLLLRELGHVVAPGASEFVGGVGREDVRFLHLHVPRRLVGQRVESGADGIQVSGLDAAVLLITAEQFVVLPDVLVDLEGQNPLRAQRRWSGLEGGGAGLSRRIEARQIDVVAGRAIGNGLRTARTRRAGKQLEHLVRTTGPLPAAGPARWPASRRRRPASEWWC